MKYERPKRFSKCANCDVCGRFMNKNVNPAFIKYYASVLGGTPEQISLRVKCYDETDQGLLVQGKRVFMKLLIESSNASTSALGNIVDCPGK